MMGPVSGVSFYTKEEIRKEVGDNMGWEFRKKMMKVIEEKWRVHKEPLACGVCSSVLT